MGVRYGEISGFIFGFLDFFWSFFNCSMCVCCCMCNVVEMVLFIFRVVGMVNCW